MTGAGRGLGRALALALAQEGARVVMAARTKKQIDATARVLQRRDAEALAVACDVRDTGQVVELIRQTASRFKRLDILVNNAGAFDIVPFENTSEELWDSIVDTNLKGTYLVTHAALPLLVRARGHIVNVVSVAGRQAFPGSSAYCASKWGQLGLTNVLRDELRDRGVRVTAVLPGAVDTSIWDHVAGDWDRAKMLRPETVAQSVVDACTQPASAATEEIVLMPATGSQ